jgi:5-methylcytosine-specific restriction endonuclease McrA
MAAPRPVVRSSSRSANSVAAATWNTRALRGNSGRPFSMGKRMAFQTCKKCGLTLPLDRDHFGNTNNRGVIGWRGSCRACMRAHSAEHAAKNPEQRAERQLRRTERERTSASAVMDVDLRELRNSLSDRCRYCDTNLDGGGEFDHLTPVARGGSGQAGNVTLACMPCNRSKQAKTLPEYLAWRRDRGLPVREISLRTEMPDVPLNDVQRRGY